MAELTVTQIPTQVRQRKLIETIGTRKKSKSGPAELHYTLQLACDKHQMPSLT